MMTARFKNGYDAGVPRSFTQLFDSLLTETSGGRSAQVPFSLKVDAFETAEAFEIHAAVPGFAKENISIDLHDGKLSISGERKFERTEDQKFHILETSFGRFSRSFTLPDNVNIDAITANFENGILRVTLPKDEQKVLRKKIEIQTTQPTINVTEKPASKAKNTSSDKAEENK